MKGTSEINISYGKLSLPPSDFIENPEKHTPISGFVSEDYNSSVILITFQEYIIACRIHSFEAVNGSMLWNVKQKIMKAVKMIMCHRK